MADYVRKILKLLSLANSPNENEAKAALLKARQLMAEHKLTERDVREVERQNVVQILTDITCSKRRDPWCIELAVAISDNYCCECFRSHTYGKQTQRVGFIGFEDDANLCAEIYEYAVECVRAETNRIRRRYADYDGTYVTELCDSYGYGFSAGVAKAFRNQDREHQQWGLVLAIPQEVQDVAANMGKPSAFRSHACDRLFRGHYGAGYAEGEQFNPSRRLTESEVRV